MFNDKAVFIFLDVVNMVVLLLIFWKIFRTIDHFNLPPRINDIVTCVILDAHGIRLELTFYSTSTTLLLNHVYVSRMEQHFGKWVIAKNETVLLL